MKYIPSPGIVLVEPLTQPKSEKLHLGTEKKETKIKQGRVIAVGENLVTDFDAELLMSDYAEVGDTIMYLTYEGSYDESFIDGKELHWVKVQDIRGRIDNGSN